MKRLRNLLFPIVMLSAMFAGCATTSPKNLLPEHVKVAQDSPLCQAVKRETANFEAFLQSEASKYDLTAHAQVLECREFENPGLGYGLVTAWFITDTNKIHTEIDGIMYFAKNDNGEWIFVQIKPVASWESESLQPTENKKPVHTI